MTAGVLLLIGEALVDLALLPFRLVVAIATSARRRREITQLLVEASRNAPQDAHPPR